MVTGALLVSCSESTRPAPMPRRGARTTRRPSVDVEQHVGGHAQPDAVERGPQHQPAPSIVGPGVGAASDPFDRELVVDLDQRLGGAANGPSNAESRHKGAIPARPRAPGVADERGNFVEAGAAAGGEHAAEGRVGVRRDGWGRQGAGARTGGSGSTGPEARLGGRGRRVACRRGLRRRPSRGEQMGDGQRDNRPANHRGDPVFGHYRGGG